MRQILEGYSLLGEEAAWKEAERVGESVVGVARITMVGWHSV